MIHYRGFDGVIVAESWTHLIPAQVSPLQTWSPSVKTTVPKTIQSVLFLRALRAWQSEFRGLRQRTFAMLGLAVAFLLKRILAVETGIFVDRSCTAFEPRFWKTPLHMCTCFLTRWPCLSRKVSCGIVMNYDGTRMENCSLYRLTVLAPIFVMCACLRDSLGV